MNQRRNILYLTNRLPYPPDKGDRIRTFHQIDRLAMSNNVYCAAFIESREDEQRVRQLRRWCRNVIAVRWSSRSASIRAGVSLLTGGTMTHGAYKCAEMSARIRRLSERVAFDSVVCFSTIMAPYVDEIAGVKHTILDMCDIDSEKWSELGAKAAWPKSWIYKLEARRLRKYEMSAVDRFDATTIITRNERRIIDTDESCEKIHVVPNGVHPASVGLRPAVNCGPAITFIGSMNYAPNVQAVQWFAERVWPVVRRNCPDARFMIVGRNPARSVRALNGKSGIEVTGAVKDTLAYLDRSRVCVAPLQIARGLPNKIIEAMAAGRPVISTTSAASCIDAVHGRDLLATDDPATFARYVVDLIDDDDACHQLAMSGQQFVTQRFDWHTVLNQFEGVIDAQYLRDGHPPASRSVVADGLLRQPSQMLGTPILGDSMTAHDSSAGV